jgi:GWxTD domain-containing protein
MKHILALILIASVSVAKTQGSNLRAYIDTKQFFAPGLGNYLEIHFQFVGYSLKYKPVSEGIQGEVAVHYELQSNDTIAHSDSYILQSPIVKDSIIDDFYDVQRIALPPGKYTLIVRLQDLVANGKERTASQTLEVKNLNDKIAFSEIQVIEYGKKSSDESPFNKSGYYMIPRISSYFSEEISTLPIYVELYHTNTLQDSLCGIKQSIKNIDNNLELNELTTFQKIKTADVIPLLRNIDLSQVPSGKFALTFTLFNRSMNELCSQTYRFERTNNGDLALTSENTILDPYFQASISNDSTAYYLESLIPISKPAEVKNILSTLKKRNKEAERKHIQAFWMQTAPTNSYDSWIKYKLQVQQVERLYANNFQEGFETDRGRVYLQYGAPTTIVTRETSPTEYPYEIWQYNKIGKFSNKRFIFYNPDLVNNAYRLLHSDMIGELKNPSWQLSLSKRNTNNGNIDDPNSRIMDHWGGESNNLFRQY